jgi:hypothetical protein
VTNLDSGELSGAKSRESEEVTKFREAGRIEDKEPGNFKVSSAQRKKPGVLCSRNGKSIRHSGKSQEFFVAETVSQFCAAEKARSFL